MSPLGTTEVLLRILAAFGAGFLLGWERESRGRPAGLRTTILACVAAAVSMIISESLFHQASADSGQMAWRPDPARLGAGILTGIGFLGAGTIIRYENFVRGVTTAATLWFVTVLGLAFGSGLYVLGSMGVVLGLLVLFGLAALERHIQADWYASVTLTTNIDAMPVDDFKNRIESLGPSVQRLRLAYDLERKQRTIEFDLRLPRPAKYDVATGVVKQLSEQDGVLHVKWQ